MTISVRGSFLEADYPVTGSILHAGSHAPEWIVVGDRGMARLAGVPLVGA
jgi:hypothetical protein